MHYKPPDTQSRVQSSLMSLQEMIESRVPMNIRGKKEGEDAGTKSWDALLCKKGERRKPSQQEKE